MRALIASVLMFSSFAATAQADFAKTLREKGFITCAAALAKVAIDQGMNGAAHLTRVIPTTPDTSPGTLIAYRNYKVGHNIFTATALAKKAPIACEVTFSQVVTTEDETCDKLRGSTFNTWSKDFELEGTAFFTQPSLGDKRGNGSLTFLPVGKGCAVHLEGMIIFTPELMKEIK